MRRPIICTRLTEALLRRGPRAEATPSRRMRTLFIAAEGYPLEMGRARSSPSSGAAAAGRLRQHAMRRLRRLHLRSTACVGRNGARGLMHLFEWETLFEVLDPDDAAAGAVRRDRRACGYQSLDRRLAGGALPHRRRGSLRRRAATQGPAAPGSRDRVRYDRPLRRHDEDPRQQCVAVRGGRRRVRASAKIAEYVGRGFHRPKGNTEVRGTDGAHRAGGRGAVAGVRATGRRRCKARSRNAPT